jgi:Rap1a immunity proteins
MGIVWILPPQLIAIHDERLELTRSAGGTSTTNRRYTMKSVLLAGAISLAVVNPTLAETFGYGFINADELYNRCTATPETDDDAVRAVTYCLGYVSAISDGENKYLCYPHPLKAGEIKDAVVRYLRHNPQERRYLAYRVVVTALNQAFDCKK